MSNFTHLHVHTQYSILDGASDIKKLMKRVKECNMKAIAITDHGNMFGVKEFYDAAIKEGIKPLIGCEAYVAAKSRKDKAESEDRAGYHLILIAKNLKGYQNLCKLITLAWKEGFYYKPRIDWELLEQYHEGLIASTACLAGEVPVAIQTGNFEKAEEKIKDFRNLFGEDFYLELMRHKTGNAGIDAEVFQQQELVNKKLIEYSTRFNVKLIATNDVHFILDTDSEAHDRLLCINTGKLVEDKARLRYTTKEYLKTPEEMAELFSDIPEAIENTMEVADKVENYCLDRNAILPDFPLPDGFDDANDYLRHLTMQGAQERYAEITDEIKDRIDFELSVVEKMGFPGYFLIVYDFIRAARSMGVWVGPGRGSAAGSVVAYCLKITDIDPLQYGLLFERFLNPDRISMPDMDIDFDEDGRDRVIKWVEEKYGHEKVAQIITFGSMAMKMAIRDVARVENLPLPEADRLAKLVPVRAKNLKEAYEMVPELKLARSSKDEKIARTLKYAEELEGSVRHTGLHACGIIIGKDDLINHIPLCTSKDSDLLVTQYEGTHMDKVGLLKMDFLGLKTLSIMKDAVENIKISKGLAINIDDIPFDDLKTFELFSKGNTTGIFQFESDGMKKYLKELKPNRFEDLIAMNALYRPGPMDHIPNYIKRKNGKEDITYQHPEMKDVLIETYGITVYQEQVMRLSMILAGFTRGEADSLRKAMGKKDAGIMAAMKEKFINGCIAKSLDEKLAKKIWTDWESFSQYAFNKSHSACYAITAYRMAYLKAHYQNEFMAAVLSRNVSDIEEITFLIDECKSLNIHVLGPDINESSIRFVVNPKGEIRFGLAAIKGLGNAAVDSIISEREKNGEYKGIFDFLYRVNLRTVNKKSIESLAMAGAFDSFDIHRAQFFYKLPNEEITFLEKLLRHISLSQNKQNTMQQSLFGESNEAAIPDPELPVCDPWSRIETLNHEKNIIGFYMSGHPLDDYKTELQFFTNFTLSQSLNLGPLFGREIRFGGMIISAAHKINKNNKPYGFFELEDFSGVVKLNLWSENYEKFKHLLEPGKCVFISAKVDKKFNGKDREQTDPIEYEIRINSMEPLYTLLEKRTTLITLYLNSENINKGLTNELDKLLQKSGKTPLKITIYDEKNDICLDMSPKTAKVDPESFIKEIRNLKDIKFKLN